MHARFLGGLGRFSEREKTPSTAGGHKRSEWAEYGRTSPPIFWPRRRQPFLQTVILTSEEAVPLVFAKADIQRCHPDTVYIPEPI